MDKVAILIPTMNRSEFLIRQLRYYVSVNSPHPVYIGDASNAEHKEKVEDVIEELQAQIEICYYHWPELNNRQTNLKLAETAKEEFCAFTGDDDFLIPKALTLCAEFLRENHDYRTAQGKAVLFTIEGGNVYGKVTGLSPYWSRTEALGLTGRERLLNFGKDYWVPILSVHRTVEFCSDLQYNNSVADKSFNLELTQTYLMICRGRSKFLDCFFLCRQAHDQRFVLADDAFDWLSGSEWQPSYQIFRNTLSEALSEIDGIGNDEASEVVKQAFWSYLAKVIPLKYHSKYGSSRPNVQSSKSNGQVSHRDSLREFIKWLPGTQRFAALLLGAKASIFSKNVDKELDNQVEIQAKWRDLSLEALLHPSTPYHKDFLPIYKIITSETVNKT